MTIIEREQQILRVSQQEVHNALDTALATQLRTEVVSMVKAVLEDALQEEVTAFLQGIEGQKPHQVFIMHVQRQQDARQTALLSQTPEIILVDGVWVEIQYVIPDEYKEDQSGHLRQCRKSEERVVYFENSEQSLMRLGCFRMK